MCTVSSDILVLNKRRNERIVVKQSVFYIIIYGVIYGTEIMRRLEMWKQMRDLR
jgi:uncharacterized protein (AIM24 family)